jgi:ATP-binding cassette, subfamily C (CFTR/MRP), member 4
LKGILAYSITLYFLELIFKLGFSILLSYLFRAVADGDTRLAYAYAGASSAIWFVGQVFRHNAYYSIPIISCRIRAGLILLMYSIVSRLTTFTAKSAELGKIINLLSSDFNSI